MTHASSLAPRTRAAAPSLGLLLCLAGLAGYPAAAEEQEWLRLLRLQVKGSHSCDVEHLVFSREVPVGGETTVEGRLRCRDGREYDFTRAKPHQKFELRLCQPSVC